jgi:hypothetical protein
MLAFQLCPDAALLLQLGTRQKAVVQRLPAIAVKRVDRLDQGRIFKPVTLYNFSGETVPVSSALHGASRRSSVFTDRNADTFARPFAVPASISLPGKQGVIILSGNDERLHQPGFIGWPAFIDHVGKHSSAFSAAQGLAGDARRRSASAQRWRATAGSAPPWIGKSPPPASESPRQGHAACGAG